MSVKKIMNVMLELHAMICSYPTIVLVMMALKVTASSALVSLTNSRTTHLTELCYMC